MKYFKLLLILSLLMIVSCNGTLNQQNKDLEKLHAAIDQFYEGVETGNGDMVTELFADNFIQMPDGWSMKIGKEIIEPNWRVGLDAGFRIKDIDTKELVVKEDIAYKIAEYYWGMVEEAKETEWYKTKNIHIWEKDSNGNWKLSVDIWNESPEL